MKTIEIELIKEVKKLEMLEKRVRERLKKAPKGYLRISNSHGRPEYYHKCDSVSSKNGRYIRKGEIELARGLAQRDYDMQLLEKAGKILCAINGFLDEYEKTDLGEIYSKTNKYRRELISPLVISDEEYVRQWLAVEYPRMGFGEDAPEFISERGERVRSKSEKIIADKLYSMGIPYRYEYPIVLEGNIRKCPDFTILKMPEREVVYLEHLGMMDKADYLEDTMYKWNLYEKNGIHLGVNLLITHETSRYPLNTRVLDEMLREVFVKENG